MEVEFRAAERKVFLIHNFFPAPSGEQLGNSAAHPLLTGPPCQSMNPRDLPIHELEPAIVADIFEYLRLHTILVLCAERLSLARETGGTPVPRQEYWQDLLRLHVLERRIGSATMMALWPHLHFSRRELWEIHHIT